MLIAACAGERNEGVFAQTTIACPERDTSLFPTAYLQRRISWYGGQWAALNAAPLCARTRNQPEVYRFVWLPTFHPAIAVAISDSTGKWWLHATRLNGAGGYAPGEVSADTSFALPATDAAVLARLIETSHFFSEATEQPNSEIGLDGAQWILEWWKDGRYLAVDRWTPRADGRYARFRDVGVWLLRRSRLADDSLVAQY
jgi:hypothetical protein